MTRLRSYPSYRTPDNDWIGPIPSHWPMSRLGYETWVRARLGWKGLTADEYVDEGFAFLSTPDIKGRWIDFARSNRITEDRFLESPEIILSVGDVLLAKDGSTLGTVNVVTDLPVPATVNSSIAVLTPGSECSGRYVRYLLSSSYMQNVIKSLRGGMGVPHLFQWDINRIEMPKPPLREQRLIADFLDRETARIDKLIDQQEQLIETLRERRIAVTFRAVTKGLDASADTERSDAPWIGDVPKHWNVLPVRRIGTLLTGTTPPTEDPQNYAVDDDGWPWVRPQDLGPATVASARLTPQGRNHVRAVPADSVLLGCIGYSLGKVGYTHEPVATNQQITSVSVSGFGRYFYYVFRAANQALWAYAIFNRLPILNNDRLGSFVLPVPPISEQRQIADYLDEQTSKIEVLIEKAQRFIELSRERRLALITAAVTGQMDVRETQPAMSDTEGAA